MEPKIFESHAHYDSSKFQEEYLKETNLYQEFNTTKKTYIKKLII